jgi:hypothetical protein
LGVCGNGGTGGNSAGTLGIGGKLLATKFSRVVVSARAGLLGVGILIGSEVADA